jgi:hypothetical protein
MQNQNPPNLIIYNTADGKASVSLLAKDGQVWMNQNQLAELFDTSKQNIGQHIANILEERELDENSGVKNFFTTATTHKKSRAQLSSQARDGAGFQLGNCCLFPSGREVTCKINTSARYAFL